MRSCCSTPKTATLALVLVVIAIVSDSGPRTSASAFEWSVGGRPELDRHAIAGLWKLTPRISPMKEFTVYPKRPDDVDKDPDVLLMLKEDGSFLQYKATSEDDTVDEEDEVDVDASWSKFNDAMKKKQKRLNEAAAKSSNLNQELVKGVWDFVDGKLILAADRDAASTSSSPEGKNPLAAKTSDVRKNPYPDTLLVGRVVATFEDSLRGNPIMQKKPTSDVSKPSESKDGASPSAVAPTTPDASSSLGDKTAEPAPTTDDSKGSATSLDAHLSVPKGSVKVGRFFYPKNHPSFFEQPMFQPTRRGAFTLRQVLGNLNAKNRRLEEQPVEKYRVKDFYNKTFLLTSHPIQQHRPKSNGNQRWSIKQNRYVDDAAEKAAEEESQRAVPIRVMQVAFHANNTFSTVAGLGQETILRGKYDVIGQDRDQLWMQVWRFGFGRSVSGSVYSEGNSLTHEDAKTYWGTIGPEARERDGEKTGVPSTPDASATDDKPASAERLEVKGSVMFGWGLEPMPVARFIMRETTTQEDEVSSLDENDEGDICDDDETDEVLPDEISSEADEEGIDWNGCGDSGAFQ